MKRVGVLGVGSMGLPMARRLAGAGFPVTGFDVDPAAVARLHESGLAVGSSPRDVAAGVDVMLLSLPNKEVLEEVLLGGDGILQADVTGKTVIDTTTATPELTRRLADEVQRRGAALLDSPVTGGVAGSESGTLSIMVGGDPNAFARQHDVYAALGTTIVHVGPSGHGQVSKMVNQMLMAAIYCSVAESFAFASQLGVDIAKVYEAVEHGGGRSALLSGMKSDILSGRYTKSGNLMMHGKDVDYIMQEANRHHAFVPIASAVNEVWKLARRKGFTDVASKDMFAVWEDILGKKLKD